tara:strand:- start:801 stop:2831 length:2031 start_codon:yes stop_codon:yes gene_type:complete
MYVEVSIPIALFKTFTYLVPSKLRSQIFLGQSVLIPFNNKKIDGFITEINKTKKYSGKVLKIININKNCFLISNELWKTVNWVAKYYISPLNIVLNHTIQYQHKKKYIVPQIKHITITSIGIKIRDSIRYPSQKKILDYLYKYKDKKIDIRDLKNISSSYRNICKTLELNHFVDILSSNNIKGIMGDSNFDFKKNKNLLILSKSQKNVYSSLIKHFEINKDRPAFLGGPPGSGKTTLYTKIVENFLNKSKQIIILVPEISLISQIYDKLNNMHPNQVGVWNSKMLQSEKSYVLSNIKNNQFKIIVGTRSSLYLPFNNLGIIIVDEEQEAAYKQDQSAPYYNARDVAIMRSQFSKSCILLVSSIPSIETYYQISRKKYVSFSLLKKYKENSNLDIKLVDMSNEKGFLSQILINEIKKRINRNEQIVILQNKRGSNSSGIQKVQSVLNKIFPELKILRYDKDTISSSNSYFDLINKFNNQEANILLGTQMIAKGIQFNNVSLVSIINADIGLYLPDFRSGERIFQLIYQFIGRAKHHSSLAIIQSFNTEEKYIKDACKQKVEENFKYILKERKELLYPPYSRLIKILLLGKNDKLVKKKSEKLAKIFSQNKELVILGPSLAPINKINDFYRYQFLLKCKKHNWQKFYNWITKNVGISIFEHSNKNLKIKIDVDPISIL